MVYVIWMSLFALAGFMIGKSKLKWPWIWLVILPVIVCAAFMILGDWHNPKPSGVTFSVLVPFFFIPPNFLAIVIGFWIGQKSAIKPAD